MLRQICGIRYQVVGFDTIHCSVLLQLATIRPCHTAAILSRETKKDLFYHAKPRSGVESMGVRLGVVKQSFFGLPGQYGRRVTRANRLAGRQAHHLDLM